MKNTEPSTLYSFQRADGRCKSAKDNLEVPVRLRPFEIRKVGSTAVMCSTSAADAELGWYREFQTDSSQE